jgi:hypothetical protein
MLYNILILIIIFLIMYWYQYIDDDKYKINRKSIFEKIKLPLLVSLISILGFLYLNKKNNKINCDEFIFLNTSPTSFNNLDFDSLN